MGATAGNTRQDTNKTTFYECTLLKSPVDLKACRCAVASRDIYDTCEGRESD